jgi:protein-disulfide isomerase
MRRSIGVAAFLLVAAGSAAFAANDVPWNLIDGGAGLKPAEQEIVAEVLGSAKCYGGCDGTILACLQKNPDDKIARRLAAFAVRRVKADQDTPDILQAIEDRRLSAFPPKKFTPDLEGIPFCGSAKAPVQVVLYADFGCPYCKATATALRALVKENANLVTYYFKNYPLKAHEQAVPAATALLAAEKQGKPWEMHDRLFAGGDDLSEAFFETCAKEIGLDLARFQADRKEKAVLDRLRAEKMEGIQFGVEKTPGILVNGKFYRGVRTWEELRDRIDEELDLLGGAR